MTWNYQIVKDRFGYSIREAFKTKEGHSWTEDECSPYGETRDEMRECILTYLNDISTLPILIIEGDKVVGTEEPLTVLNDNEK